MTDEQLAAIRARCELATRGPWDGPLKDLGEVPSFAELDFYFSQSFEVYPAHGEIGPVSVVSNRDDANFIIHVREDVPALLAEIERLRGLLSIGAAS